MESIINKFDPRDKRSEENKLNFVILVLLVFGVVALHHAYKEFNFITALNYQNLTFNQIQIWLLTILIPISAAFLIWRGKMLGWYIGVSYFIYNLMIDSISLFYEYAHLGTLNGLNSKMKFWSILIMAITLYFLYSMEVIRKLGIKRNAIILVTLVVLSYSIFQSFRFVAYLNSVLN